MVQPHGYVIAPVGLGVGFVASTPSGGVNFRVDPDNAEQFIKDMSDVLKRLEQVDRIARGLVVKAPGNDNFSRDAAEVLNDVNMNGPRAHLVANQEARVAVEGMVENLKLNLQSYRDVESINMSALQKRG